ncbi:hypothetical protein C8R44DRAFT_871685 [Mycena epipterygia]|nr:hypothetical protein C8R44DRAFT_871685 [Mycena epipterygia]
MSVVVLDLDERRVGCAGRGPRIPLHVQPPPPRKLATAATLVMTCDNHYVFWLNGNLPGTNVLALAPFNDDVTADPAALLVSAQVQLTGGALVNFVTNGTWRTLNGQPPPLNFQLPTFNDSTWNTATACT